MKNDKKNKVKTAPNRKNPDTTKGRYVTESVLAEARAVQVARDMEDEKKAAKSEETKEKKLDRLGKHVEWLKVAASHAAALMYVPKKRLSMDMPGLVGNGGVMKTDELRAALRRWARNDKVDANCDSGMVRGMIAVRVAHTIGAWLMAMAKNPVEGMFMATEAPPRMLPAPVVCAPPPALEGPAGQ